MYIFVFCLADVWLLKNVYRDVSHEISLLMVAIVWIRCIVIIAGYFRSVAVKVM